MCLAVFETFGILYVLKMLDVFESLFSTWSHHHLYLRLGRVYGVHVGRRGFGGGGCVGGLPKEDVEAARGDFVTDLGPEYMDSL